MTRAALSLFLARKTKTLRQSLYTLGTYLGQVDLTGPDPFNILPNSKTVAATLVAEPTTPMGIRPAK